MAIHTISEVREIMTQRVKGFNDLNPAERTLQVMAYFADTVHVMEEGNNRGDWVESFLRNAGVDPGNPWCASAIKFAADVAGAWSPKSGAAAVVTWKNLGRSLNKIFNNPERGMLCYMMHSETTGHIGIVVRTALGLTYSIEGNTSSGVSGSQRDGDGLYRRVRKTSFWDGFIKIG